MPLGGVANPNSSTLRMTQGLRRDVMRMNMGDSKRTSATPSARTRMAFC